MWTFEILSGRARIWRSPGACFDDSKRGRLAVRTEMRTRRFFRPLKRADGRAQRLYPRLTLGLPSFASFRDFDREPLVATFRKLF